VILGPPTPREPLGGAHGDRKNNGCFHRLSLAVAALHDCTGTHSDVLLLRKSAADGAVARIRLLAHDVTVGCSLPHLQIDEYGIVFGLRRKALAAGRADCQGVRTVVQSYVTAHFANARTSGVMCRRLSEASKLLCCHLGFWTLCRRLSSRYP
jgi:hypothetical protein